MKLARNIVWNAAGLVLPLLVGIAVVPAIVKGLGTERFGFLSVIWMLIGYFSIFDLGLSRTLTKLVADRLAAGRDAEIAPLASTALIMVIVSSAVMSVVVALSASWIAGRVFASSPALIPEASTAIACIAVALPFVLLATLMGGLLEAYQEFALINAVRIPVGILILVAPLAVLPFSKHLGVITAAIVGLRVVNAGVLTLLGLRVVPQLRQHALTFHKELVRPLMTYGGWLTVSNVVGPITIYFDRFLIAALLGGAAVAYYTVPYDVLTRLWVLPTAIQGVLFPAFASMHEQKSPRVVAVFKRSSEATLLLMTPPVMAGILLTFEALRLWVGVPFALNSTNVARVLAVGVLVNSLARTPFTFVQSAGRASWTAMLHLLEMPLYILVLWWLLKVAGIDGAAYAWTARIVADTIVLYVMAARLEPGITRTAAADALALLGVSTAAVLIGYAVASLWVRMLLVAAVSFICAVRLLQLLRGDSPSYRSALLSFRGKL
jgi:O-antigen/teichoic acid export membrane protein